MKDKYITKNGHKGTIFSKPSVGGPEQNNSFLKLDGLQSEGKALLIYVYFTTSNITRSGSFNLHQRMERGNGGASPLEGICCNKSYY